MIKTDNLDPLAGLWKMMTCSHLKSVLRGCGEENRKKRLRMGAGSEGPEKGECPFLSTQNDFNFLFE